MKTIKVSEAIGAPLNYLVETLEIARMRANGDYIKEWWEEDRRLDPSPYSTDWQRAGEIIEWEHICLVELNNTGVWRAFCNDRSEISASPLVSAMRCYVASNLGDVAEVPEELA